MTHLKDLSQAEQLELLHARLATVEAFLSEAFQGFFDDIETYAVNVLEDTTLNQSQKDLLQSKLLIIRSKYRRKGK